MGEGEDSTRGWGGRVGVREREKIREEEVTHTNICSTCIYSNLCSIYCTCS